MYRANMPVALTIAGSDSGGEAGIQADLKTFAFFEVHGTSAITYLTAQNRKTISALHPCPPEMVRAQMEAVAEGFSINAAKTGMLFSGPIVREVARFFRRRPEIPLVVDPVIISTSGRRLLQPDGLKALERELLPLAAIVTPNVAEAEILLGKKINSAAQLRAAARTIYGSFGCDALVKGGHLRGAREAVDFFYGRDGEWMISAPRFAKVFLHGTGCVYSAALTAGLALGKSVIQSVELAKQHITDTIASASQAGKG
jgi:hydroxymethylpyrimidine/phosphomethylpyrimidine kinase